MCLQSHFLQDIPPHECHHCCILNKYLYLCSCITLNKNLAWKTTDTFSMFFFHVLIHATFQHITDDHSGSSWMLSGEWDGLPVVVCLLYTNSLFLKGNPAYSSFVLPPTLCLWTVPAYTPLLTTFPGKRSHLPLCLIFYDLTVTMTPNIRNPALPTFSLTGLQKNLHWIVFHLPFASPPGCSFYILPTLVWGAPVLLG